MDKFFSEHVKNVRQRDEKPEGGETEPASNAPKKLPKGVVLGKDGKPCRSCTSVADWFAMAKKNPRADSATMTTNATSLDSLPSDCPPDVDTLGRHTWTLLHSISASYPPRASPTQQSEMKQFLSLFSKLYPCWVCADDFRTWMSKKGNEPRVEGRDGLGKWMCKAHNEVNRKLGKEEFDCGKWEERWRTGWKDGRCD